MKRVAIYTRTATTGRDNGALEAQEHICRAFATEQGWDVVRVYADEGYSGNTADRPGLQALLSDANAGDVQAVVVAGCDRLARHAALLRDLTQVFVRNNVAVIITNEVQE